MHTVVAVVAGTLVGMGLGLAIVELLWGITWPS